MDHFVNEYRYTPDVIEEGIGSWWKWKFKNVIYTLLAVMLLLIPIALLSRNVVYLKLEAICLLIFATFLFKKHRGIKTEKERVQVVYPDEPPVIRVEIGEDVRIKTRETDRSISLSSIEGVAETKSLIVLFITGLMTIILHKDGFVEGTPEECLAYLRERTARK